MSLKLNERYPARFNNPTAGYPQGSFKNRTTPTAKDGSYLEKDWANDKEGFFQSLLSAAGITANGAVDAVGASQFFDALQVLKQIQEGTAFTTAGSAGALTLAPTPAISAYSTPLRFRVKFSQASTGTDTINVSGLGAKNIKQYNSTGVKVAGVFAASQLADVEYDGTDFVLLDQLPTTVAQRPQGLRGATVNWKASANGTSSNITCTGDSVTIANSAGDPSVATNIATNLNTAVAASATVDGMASGAVAANTWYGVYVWKNTATTGVRVTGDSAFTTGLPPVAPAAGFDAWAFVGVFLTDSTGKPLRYFQNQRSYELSKLAGSNVATLPIAASGNTSGAVTAVSLTGKIPPGASKVKLSTYTPGDANAQCFAMPSTAYATSEYAGGSGPGISNYFLSVVPVEILLQGSTNFAWVSSGPNSKITLLGWEI